jgi:predicted flap endonuclease-1-like 5' DNA nuclease
MRSDYALYVVAIVFFLITALSFALVLAEVERNLWIVTTVVLGLLFLGLGYTQRPRIQTAKVQAEPLAIPPPAIPAPVPATAEVMKEEPMEPTAEATPPQKLELSAVKGIKAKRAEQLKAIGIASVEELANASANDIGEKLKISPKITERWIEHAKLLLEKS